MLIISCVSQKGGVGKTSIVIHLAIAAVEAGLEVLVIDLDLQRSTERWSERRRAEKPVIVAGLASKLPEMIKTARAHGVDIVLIDTPPTVDKTALAAAKAADIVLVPTGQSFLDLQAIGDTVRMLKEDNSAGKAVIVFNGLKGAARQRLEAIEAAREYGLEVLDASLADRIAYSRSLDRGKGVTELGAKNAAAKEIKALLNDLLARQPQKRRKLVKVNT